MDRRVLSSGILLLAAMLLTASAPALAGQKVVEFTVPACQ